MSLANLQLVIMMTLVANMSKMKFEPSPPHPQPKAFII
jgi:hypothetical protein